MTELQTSNRTVSVWALLDDRPGNASQVQGVTDVLAQRGWPVVTKTIRYTGWAHLPNIIRRATLAGVTDASRAQLAPPWPDLVVAAGRRAVPVARWIKRQSDGNVRLAQIMFPGRAGAKDFDLIAVPDHDAKPRVQAWPNVVTMTGAPTRITQARLAPEGERCKFLFKDLPRPLIALIVGGATRRLPFTRKRAFDLGFQVADLAKASGGSVLLTTSRRTGQGAELALMQVLPEPRHVHLWGRQMDNPYLAYLALADAIVVTGDSVTMCAEACATDKPVYIYAPPRSVSAKHTRLHRQLYDLGCARPLSEATAETLTGWTHAPLTPAADVANAIAALFSQAKAEG